MQLRPSSLSSDQKDCLLVLAYLYLQNGKSQAAQVILEGLQTLYPRDYHIMRSLAYAYMCEGYYEHTLTLLESCNHPLATASEVSFGLLLKSKALWRLGKAHEAHQVMLAFLDNQKALT